MEGLTKLRHVASGENFMAHNELVSGQFSILNTKTNHDAINSLISKIVVSITKSSIVIGSPGVYLSRNRRLITWVSNCRCPRDFASQLRAL